MHGPIRIRFTLSNIAEFVGVYGSWFLSLQKYRRTPVYAGNTFQDLQLLRETADNTGRYI